MPTPVATPSGVYKPATATSKAENVPVPVLSEVGKQKTEAGAKEFVKYWVATVSYAYETADVSLIKAISGSSCSGCNVFITTIPEDAKSLVYTGATMKVSVIETRGNAQPGVFIFAAQVHQAASNSYQSGRLVKSYPADDNAYALDVRWVEGRWTMADARVITQDGH